MDTRHKSTLVSLGLILCATCLPFLTQSQDSPSNLLVHPGFEETTQPGSGLPDDVGLWSGDLSSIASAENGIAPRSGEAMLRFDATYPIDPAQQDQTAQVWQLIGLEQAAVDPSSGQILGEASVWINRVDLGEKTDRVFQLIVQAHENSSLSDFNPANAIASNSTEIESDDELESWEELRISLKLPPSTTFIAIALAAQEDRSDNGQGEFDGHYADDATLVVRTVETAPLEISSVNREAGQVMLEWTGGTSPYVIQQRSQIGEGSWEDLKVTETPVVQIPGEIQSSFFRIASVGSETDTVEFNLPFLTTLSLDPQLETELLDQLNTIYPDATRSRIVGFDLDAIQPVKVENEVQTLPLQLPLFEDVNLKAINEEILRYQTNEFSWIGRIEGEVESRVVLSVQGDQASGLIQNGTQLYQITRLAEGQYGVVEINQDAFPQEMPPTPPPLPLPQVAAASASEEGPPGRRFINVMVVYTEEAADADSNIELTIQNAIDVTNSSYQDSDIPQRLHLVHTAQVDYDETGAEIETHRNRLQDPDDGFMDEVHNWRNQYHADLVAIIVENSAWCGIAFIMEDVSPSFDDWGFSVTVRSCAVGNFSFAHELGHNMGARHDRFVDDTDGSPYQFNHGFVNVDGGWRTVMAYRNACTSEGESCTRVGRWSTPSLNYLGSPTGLSVGNADAADNRRTLMATDFVVSQFRTLGRNEAGDRFGAALAMGDFNGDGLNDLAVGAPNEAPAGDPESGVIFVFAGTPFGLAPWEVLSQAGGLGANEAGDLFGASLASGDFNGDGFDDLAVGAPGEAPRDDPQSGTVFLFRGGSQGLSHWHGISQGELGVNEAGDEFGYSLAAGDFNGDGKADLAVGAPGEAPSDDPRSGIVFLFEGTAGQMDAWQIVGQDSLETNESDDRFGEALAVGDFDNDGKDDLAVGAPGETVADGPASGAAFLYQGSTGGLVAIQFIEQDTLGINEADDRFGKALAAGDFNRDGRDDLAVGAPGEAPGGAPEGGSFFVYQGGSSGLSPARVYTQSGLGINEAGDLFGSSFAAGDFNGDGWDDLAVGAPAEAPTGGDHSGYLFVFRGGSTGLTTWDGLGQRGLGDDEEGDEFTFALAAGDVDGDGLADIAVGAPGESPASDPQSGFVFTFKGRSSGDPFHPWVGLTEEQ